MPIIQTLGNPGMKERHWERVSEIIGFPIRVDAELTLAKIIDYGLDEYIDRFEAISEAATKENNLEKHLNKMLVEWVDMEFSAHLYRYPRLPSCQHPSLFSIAEIQAPTYCQLLMKFKCSWTTTS